MSYYSDVAFEIRKEDVGGLFELGEDVEDVLKCADIKENYVNVYGIDGERKRVDTVVFKFTYYRWYDEGVEKIDGYLKGLKDCYFVRIGENVEDIEEWVMGCCGDAVVLYRVVEIEGDATSIEKIRRSVEK